MGVLNNIIVMNRGDTYEFNLLLSVDGQDYILSGDDAVYFGLMDPGQPFELALVRKKFTVKDIDAMGNLFIQLQPEDTVDLLPGKYFYAVKLHMNHDELDAINALPTGRRIDRVVTVINKTKFIICD